MSDDLTPLPSDIVQALTAERGRLQPGPETLAEVRARVAQTASALSTAGVAGASVATLATAKLVVALVVGAVLGGGVVAVVGRDQPAAPTPVAVVGPPVEKPGLVEEVPVVVAALPAPARPRAPVVAVPPPAPSIPVEGVDVERLLIERATVALARGEALGALDACEEHLRRFPSGALVEERESLAIRALGARGEEARARARALAFVRRFPDSMQRYALEAWIELDAGVTE